MELEQYEDQQRVRYLYALGVGMGGHPEAVVHGVNQLMDTAAQFVGNMEQGQSLSPAERVPYTSIANLVTGGAITGELPDDYDGMDVPVWVGNATLAVLQNPPESGHCTQQWEYVHKYTEGQGTADYLRMLGVDASYVVPGQPVFPRSSSDGLSQSADFDFTRQKSGRSVDIDFTK